MHEALKNLPDNLRGKLEKKRQPEWMGPMLAILTDRYFSDPGWIFERKLDGQRCLVMKNKQKAELWSGNRKTLNATYPDIKDAVEDQRQANLIMDGEIVAFRKGITSFSRLQGRMQVRDSSKARESNIKVYYYAIDLIYLDGYDLTSLLLRYRKALLHKVLKYKDPLRFTPHRNEQGEKYLTEACRKGWEGLIAKRAVAPYSHGRFRNWLKFKCVNRQELVIGGFTEPSGQRKGFGALLVGFYDGGDLHYAGKIGTGYDHDTLQRIRRKLDSLETGRKPFADDDIKSEGVHWVKPGLVCEVGFTEWTSEGKLRHPGFVGLRDDKDPQRVHKETPL